MTDAEKKVLEGFLSKTLKMDTEEVAGLYNDAGELTDLSKASEADSARVKKLKEDASSQYSRGLKEGAGKIEKELRDKYDIDSDLLGVELVDHIVTEKMNEATGSTEDIAKHPEYVRLTLEHEKQLKAKDKEWQKKVDDVEGTFKRQTMFARVKERALTELETLKPILPEDPKKAQRWRDKFIDEFTKFDYQEDEGNLVVLKEGKPITDSHGYSKTFADHVRDTANDFFEFQASKDERSSSGNKSRQEQPFKAPRNNDEYTEAMKKAKTPEERIEIMESYVKK